MRHIWTHHRGGDSKHILVPTSQTTASHVMKRGRKNKQHLQYSISWHASYCIMSSLGQRHCLSDIQIPFSCVGLGAENGSRHEAIYLYVFVLSLWVDDTSGLGRPYQVL